MNDPAPIMGESMPLKASVLDHSTILNEYKVFIGGFPFEYGEDKLVSYMKHFGSVRETKLHISKDGVKKGYAFVLFEEKESVKKVLSIQEHTINGKYFECKEVVS
jgi:RNA recognition motif-containing protein